MNGVIVLGHGSRSKDAYDTFFNIVEKLRERIGGEVEGCFMELSQPNIPETIEKLYKKGVRNFTVLPYFLFTGMHIKKDIPEILEEQKKRFNDIKIEMAEPINYHNCLVDILMERLEGDKKCI